MLAASNRLRKGHDIARVYQRGSYGAGGGFLSVKALKTGRPDSRAVVVVGKKVDKRAVLRNRMRRRLIEALRERWGTVPAGYDIVISVHKDVSSLPAERLRELLQEALRRAQVTT